MALLLPPRLAAILGAGFEDLDATNLDRLIGMRQDVDLEFKSTLYERNDPARRELALDVASFANSRGGLLIIGFAEQSGIATGSSPVTLPTDDEEDLRMQKVIASHVFPHPTVRIRVLDRGDGSAFIIVAIPRSPLRPHAVEQNDRLRYVVREGTGRRSLTESEVADLYRNRFITAANHVARVGEIHEDGRAQLREGAWLCVSLVSEEPGAMVMGYGVPGRMSAWYERQRQSFLLPSEIWRRLHATTGFRRILLSDQGPGQVYRVYAELHIDGSGFIAVARR